MDLAAELAGRRWRRLLNLVVYLPRDSATMFVQVGEAALWGPAENMAAATVDLLQAANWQRAGNKNAARPKPWPRPGVVDPNRKKFGDRKMTVEQWEQRRQARRAKREEVNHGDRVGDRVRVGDPLSEGVREEAP